MAIDESFQTGNPIVDKMRKLQITGKSIPVIWFQTIRKDRTKTADLNTILVLADVMYWYRPTEILDEVTGKVTGIKKKFENALLQRSYQQLSEELHITVKEVDCALTELEELGVVKRIYQLNGNSEQQVDKNFFLELDVDLLKQLTYPEWEPFGVEAKSRYPPKPEEKSRRTENSYKEKSSRRVLESYWKAVDLIKEQISFDALKHDYPYDMRVDEIMGIIADVMTTNAETIRVNREDKPAQIVKAQFAKLNKHHIDYVLHCMDENRSKARNIRAVLITVLYNSINTISSYYGNLFQYHMEQNEGREKEI